MADRVSSRPRCPLGPAYQPVDPARHALAAPGRHLQHGDVGIDRPRMLNAVAHIEVDMRQKVNLGQNHRAGGSKGVRIFERLVVALRHREDRHLLSLAEIEARGTNEIADILDEQDRVPA